MVDQSSLALDTTTIPKVSEDPFFTPPSPAALAACPKGYVLRSRKVNVMWGLGALSTSALSGVIDFLEKIPLVGTVIEDLPVINDVAKNMQLDAYQLLFRSTDNHGVPMVAATTVVVPQGGIWKVFASKLPQGLHVTINGDKEWNAPTQSRPLISYQADQDATDPDTSPSYFLRVGWLSLLADWNNFWVTTPSGATAQNLQNVLNRLFPLAGYPVQWVLGLPKNKIPQISIGSFEILLGLPALLEGYAVAFPDHEGPKGGFINGRQSGQIVLDGIIAARYYQHYVPGTELNPNSKVALWAYSGGSAPTQWAVELANTYGHDPNHSYGHDDLVGKSILVGAAVGADPATDVGKMLDNNNNKLTIGLLPLAIGGLVEAYPEYRIREEVLSKEGNDYITEAGKYGTIDGVVELDFKWLDKTNGGRWTPLGPDLGIEYFTKDKTKSINSWPQVVALEQANSINYQPSQAGTPRIPTLIYHDQQDGLVPLNAEDTLIRKYCKEGSPVQVMRLNSTIFPSLVGGLLSDVLWLPGQIDQTSRTWQLISRDAPGAIIHAVGEVTSDLSALTYITARFDGSTAPRNDCDQIPSQTIDNNPPNQWVLGSLFQPFKWDNAPWEPQPPFLSIPGIPVLPILLVRQAYKPLITN